MKTLRIRYETALLALAATLGGCAAVPPAPAARSMSGDTAIEVSPGACFGACPMYSVSVDQTDRIDFRPVRFTRVEQPVQRPGAPGTFEEVERILAPLRPAAVGETDISQQCDNTITDLPYYHIKWKGPEGERTVQFYPGCVNRDTQTNERRIADAIAAYRIDDLVKRP